MTEKKQSPVKKAFKAKEIREMPVITRSATLIEPEKYLKTGAHIGTKFKSGEMKRFIYKERKDGLKVLNVQTLDERIKLAASFLSKYALENIVVVSRKLYGQTPVEAFSETVGCQQVVGRFIPGTFTNPRAKKFLEPQVLVVTEPDSDKQAIAEASSINLPIIALASTNNALQNIDFVIPVNNKGRKSIALVYWLLAKELLKLKGVIKKDKDFTKKLEDFEFKIKEREEMPKRFLEKRKVRGRGKRKGRRKRKK